MYERFVKSRIEEVFADTHKSTDAFVAITERRARLQDEYFAMVDEAIRAFVSSNQRLLN